MSPKEATQWQKHHSRCGSDRVTSGISLSPGSPVPVQKAHTVEVVYCVHYADDFLSLLGICFFLRQFHVENVPPLFAIWESCKCLLQSPVRLCNAAAT
jgi:hypothetical protein